jgi:hypothetical protein
MCLCMRVCIHMYTYVHMYVQTHTHTHAQTHTLTNTAYRFYTHTHSHSNTNTQSHTHTHKHILTIPFFFCRFHLTRLIIYNVMAILGVLCFTGFSLLFLSLHGFVGRFVAGPRVAINMVYWLLAQVCTFIYIYTPVYIHRCVYIHTCIYTHLYTTPIYTHWAIRVGLVYGLLAVRAGIHMYVCIHVWRACVCVCVCVCVCARARVFVCVCL